MTTKTYNGPPPRKDKAMDITVNWPGSAPRVFRCLGGYDSKAYRWRLDLATLVGPVPADLTTEALIPLLTEAIAAEVERDVVVRPGRLDLEAD